MGRMLGLSSPGAAQRRHMWTWVDCERAKGRRDPGNRGSLRRMPHQTGDLRSTVLCDRRRERSPWAECARERGTDCCPPNSRIPRLAQTHTEARHCVPVLTIPIEGSVQDQIPCCRVIGGGRRLNFCHSSNGAGDVLRDSHPDGSIRYKRMAGYEEHADSMRTWNTRKQRGSENEEH